MKGSYQFEELEGREREAAFLKERANLRLEGFTDLLINHNFPEAGDILEVGCGQGIRTGLMAKNFPKAKVVGVDRSLELLKEAYEEVKELENIKFVEGNLYELPFPDESFDFIYSRLVFMHLNQPSQAMEELKRVLRPGGRILIEDADRDCMFFEPAPPSFKEFWHLVQEGQRRLGGDPNIGRKLSTLMAAAGLEGIRHSPLPIVGGGEDIAFLAKTLLPSLNVYLRPEERAFGEEAIRELLELSQTSTATFYHFWFAVSGAKA